MDCPAALARILADRSEAGQQNPIWHPDTGCRSHKWSVSPLGTNTGSNWHLLMLAMCQTVFAEYFYAVFNSVVLKLLPCDGTIGKNIPEVKNSLS